MPTQVQVIRYRSDAVSTGSQPRIGRVEALLIPEMNTCLVFNLDVDAEISKQRFERAR